MDVKVKSMAWVADDATLDHHISAVVSVDATTLRCYLRREDDRFVLFRIEVTHPAGITSTTWRDIPIGEVTGALRERIMSHAKALASVRDPRPEVTSRARRAAGDAQRSPSLTRRGPRGLGDDHYRRIAVAYLDLADAGMGRGLVQELARQEKRPTETVRDWIHEARNRGFLTKGERGRVGAFPGPQLTGYKPPSRRKGQR